jgi:DNA polymerase III epsilon subunit-like protein
MDLILDTEFAGNRLLEVALVDENDQVLIHTRVRPTNLEFDAVWSLTAQRVHHIYPEDVEDAPAQSCVAADVVRACEGHRVVAFNIAVDLRFFPGLASVAQTACAMRAAQAAAGQGKLSLAAALERFSLDWTFGAQYTALADARACRALWRRLQTEQPKQAELPLAATEHPPLAPAGRRGPALAPAGSAPNAGAAWTRELRSRLRASYGPTPPDISAAAKDMGRTCRSIAYQMAIMGLIERTDIERLSNLAQRARAGKNPARRG